MFFLVKLPDHGYKMTPEKISMRERILAVIKGDPLDRVPFVLYDAIFPTEILASVLGWDRFGLMRWSEVHKVEHPNCKFETQEFWKEDTRWHRTTLFTPIGSIYEERAFEPVLDSSSIRKHYLQEKRDYEIFWYYLEDSILLEDYERYHRDQNELGDMGIPLVAVERTPFQQMWIQWAGLDNLAYHWIDFPEHVEKTIELLSARQKKLFEIAYYSPAEFIDFPDNITAPAIGPKKFAKYCVSFYNELADMLAEKNKLVFVHMDGDLKPLWSLIAESKVGGLDSFSPSPDNDTSVIEAVNLWPEKRLFVNFPSSVHLQPPERVRAEAENILLAAGHTGRLQIQISENVPPFSWKTSLPEIVRAIEDFGKP
jgi:hypothetical protein